MAESGDLRAELRIGDKKIELPVIVGSEGERAIDIRKLRDQTGLHHDRPGLRQHGRLQERDHVHRRRRRASSAIAGYPIEELAERASFLEVAYLLIHGELPTEAQLRRVHRVDPPPHACCTRTSSASSTRCRRTRTRWRSVLGGGRRARDVLPDSLDPRDPRQVEARAPADRQDADDRGLLLQALDRPAVHLSRQLDCATSRTSCT